MTTLVVQISEIAFGNMKNSLGFEHFVSGLHTVLVKYIYIESSTLDLVLSCCRVPPFPRHIKPTFSTFQTLQAPIITCV